MDTAPPASGELVFGGCQWHIPILVVNNSSTGWCPSPFLTSLCCRTHPLPPALTGEPHTECSSQSQSPNHRVKPISHSEQSKVSPVGAAASTFIALAQGCLCFMPFAMEPVKERTCNCDLLSYLAQAHRSDLAVILLEAVMLEGCGCTHVCTLPKPWDKGHKELPKNTKS